MAGFSTNRVQIERQVRASMMRFEASLSVKIMVLCGEIDFYIKSLTPVHTGQSVRNYIWTTDVAFHGVLEAIDNGPTGKTNSMSLGSEPRRHINEETAAASLAALNFSNPFQTFILTNNAPQIGGLELGLLPGPPLKSRSPAGMFGLTHAWVMLQIYSQGFTN
jgi:hypothetical protein